MAPVRSNYQTYILFTSCLYSKRSCFACHTQSLLIGIECFFACSLGHHWRTSSVHFGKTLDVATGAWPSSILFQRGLNQSKGVVLHLPLMWYFGGTWHHLVFDIMTDFVNTNFNQDIDSTSARIRHIKHKQKATERS